MRKSKIDQVCCTCDRNKRIKDETGHIECVCEVDGHNIGYVETFEHSCSRYMLDKAYRPGGKWYDPNDFEREKQNE